MSENSDDFYNAITAVETEYNSDIYLFSGSISEGNYGELIAQVKKPREHQSALVIMSTYGGDANAGFKISRLFQDMYETHTLYVPRFCYSAGTLIALGANKLLLDSFSEMGPLDVQLQKPNEIGGRKSGLLSRSAFESAGQEAFALFEQFMLGIKRKSGGAVTFEMAAQIASQMATNIVSPMIAKIDPDVVGSDYRDLNVATEYGIRLAEIGENVENGTVEALVSRYPSHDFIIDQREANKLFKRIDQPSEALYVLVGAVSKFAFDQANPPVIKKVEKPDAPTDQKQGPKKRTKRTESEDQSES